MGQVGKNDHHEFIFDEERLNCSKHLEKEDFMQALVAIATKKKIPAVAVRGMVKNSEPQVQGTKTKAFNLAGNSSSSESSSSSDEGKGRKNPKSDKHKRRSKSSSSSDEGKGHKSPKSGTHKRHRNPSEK